MKLALAQMLVEGGQPERNLARAEARIAEAAQGGADLVLLPETLDYGWTHPLARETVSGRSLERLLTAARVNNIIVCAGLVEPVGDRLFNAAYLIDRDGQVLAHHRKINELDIALELYSVGETVDAVAETEFGNLGVHICADGFAERQWISRELAAKGARGILSPCAWAVPADFSGVYGQLWRDNYEPVSRECGIWIAGCSNVGPIEAGPWRGRKCIGNSLVFDAGGREILTGPFGEEADELLWVEV